MNARPCTLALSLAVAVSTVAPAQATWPTKGWPAATPQAVGLNARVLDSLDAEIASGRYGNVDRMLIIRRGRVAFDKSYPHDYDRIYADSVHVTGGALNPHDETGPYADPWRRATSRRSGMAFPDDDMVVVFNGWNILPGRPGLPRAQVTARLVNAIVER